MSDIKEILTANKYTLDKSFGRGTLCASYSIVNNTDNKNYFGKVYIVNEINEFSDPQTNFKDLLENERKTYQLISDQDDSVHFANLIISPQSYIFVTEFFSCQTLRDVISGNSGRPMSIRTIIDVLQQIISSIHRLHSKNISHKNVKPSNVLILPDNSMKLTDMHLGCSLFLLSKYQQIARTHLTLQYLGPEYFTNKPINDKVDIWPIGIIGLEMISGINKVPIGELLKSSKKVVTDQVKNIDNEGNNNNDIKKDLICDLIVKCLSVDINKRSSSFDLVNHQLFAIENTNASNIVIQQVSNKIIKKTPLKSTTKTTKSTKAIVQPKTDNSQNKSDIQTNTSSVKTIKKSGGKTVATTVKTTKTVSKTVNIKRTTNQSNSNINRTKNNTNNNNITVVPQVTETTTILVADEIIHDKIDEAPKKIAPVSSEPQGPIIINTNNYTDTTSIITELINKVSTKQMSRKDAATEYLNITDRSHYFPNDDESRNKLIDCAVSENRTTLDVSGTKFGNKNINYVKSFFDIMKMQNHLKEINFFMCLLENDSLHDLYLAMTYLINLESINLNCNYINDKFVVDLSNHFKYMTKVTVLKLSTDCSDDIDDHKVHDNGLQILSSNLKYIPSLEIFHFNGHKFTSIGFSYFCESLISIPKLKELKLGENKLNDGSIDSFSKSFKYLSKLETLELRDNDITNDGLHSIGNNLSLLKSLKVLYVHKNPLNDKPYLELLIKKHRNLKIHSNFSTEMKSTSSDSAGCLII